MATPRYSMPSAFRGWLMAAVPVLAASACSKASESCHDTKCCEDASLRCFEKNDEWATCMADCTPGEHEDDDEAYRTPWSCTDLGAEGGSQETQADPAGGSQEAQADPAGGSQEAQADPAGGCSKEFEDCRSTGCCVEDGFSCFSKNEKYATCRASCEPGVHEDDPPDEQTFWSCEVVQRTCQDAFQQCGGHEHTGTTCCRNGCTCDTSTDFYHQCLPNDDASETCDDSVTK